MNLVKAKRLQNKIKPILVPISLLYGMIVNIRDVYLEQKPKRDFSKVKIISIGNIVAGGVGKTPLVISLARFFKQYGKVCVITNNYPLKDKRIHIVSLDGHIFEKPPKASDEPYMIAKKVDVSVIASKNREAAIELASGYNFKFIILDDALHKRNIKKDLEICVLDKYRPFDNGLYLPAGMLRYPKRALKYCDMMVCIDKGYKNEQAKDIFEDCIDAKMSITGVFLNGKRIDIKDKTVVAFSGIGNPESFLVTLKKLGAKVEAFLTFEDHHIYTEKDLEMIRRKQGELKAQLLLTTFKDYVKLEHEKDIGYVDIDIEIDNLKDKLREFLYG